MMVTRLAAVSTLISDRLACSWSRFDALPVERTTEPERWQTGVDPAHPNVDQQRQLGHRQDADLQQAQARAFGLIPLLLESHASKADLRGERLLRS